MTASDEARKALEGVTPGPWRVDGVLWNQIVWSGADNRVCFLAHSNGLDDDRDVATARFIAWCREGVPALAAELAAQTARADAVEARAAGLTAKLDAWLGVYDNCEIATHVCCCGDDMDRHAEPMGCGHVATDHGGYIAGKLAEETRAALAKLKGGDA